MSSSKDEDKSSTKDDELDSEYLELVEADKKLILEATLKESLENIARGMDKINISSSDSDSGISVGSQQSFKEVYDSIFEDHSDDETELDEAWENMMKLALEAFKRETKS